mmetsp:Transcript_11369/g.23955  ORF Transcript_11369/g.23955 Transcript_11369/m.23955 type:complete len:177 (-) Transcript_11369:819-1349(-)
MLCGRNNESDLIMDGSNPCSLKIMDMRPKSAAMANRTQGYGYENTNYYRGASINFYGIGNIQLVRLESKSLRALFKPQHQRHSMDATRRKYKLAVNGPSNPLCFTANSIPRALQSTSHTTSLQAWMGSRKPSGCIEPASLGSTLQNAGRLQYSGRKRFPVVRSSVPYSMWTWRRKE